MIGGLKLILDQHQAVTYSIFGQDISIERVDRYFSFFGLKGKPHNFAKLLQVLEQPGSKIVSLMSPSVARRDILYTSNVNHLLWVINFEMRLNYHTTLAAMVKYF
jgi:hypothetical protein